MDRQDPRYAKRFETFQRPFAAFVVCRQYWKHNFKTLKRLGAKRGGVFLDGIHFR